MIPTKSVRAVIFDKDGVLVDSEKLKAEAWQDVLSSYGVLGGSEWYLSNLGPTVVALAEIAKATFYLHTDVQAIAESWTLKYRAREHCAQAIQSNVEFLAAISTYCKIGVASSMDQASIEAEMRRFGCMQYISLCVSGTSVKHNKPAPDVYLAAAEALGTNPAQCVAIEDSPSGVAAAKAAGMLCIGYRNPLYALNLSEADGILGALTVEAFETIAGVSLRLCRDK